MDKHLSNVRKVKHFLLGAGLVLTLAASTTLAQVSPPVSCPALGGQLVAPEDCPDAANQQFQGGFQQQPGQAGMPMQGGKSFIPDPNMAASEKSNLEQSLASGALQAGQIVSCGSAGMQRILVEDCIKTASDIAAGGSPPNMQFNQQQFGLPQQQNQNFQQFLQPCAKGQSPTPGAPCIPSGGLTQQQGQQMPQSNFQNQQSLFGQQQFNQQQTQQKIVAPTIKGSNVTLASKGLKLALKMQVSLNSKYSKAKGRTKKLAAVRAIAKKLPTLCRYISSGDDEADLDESAFDCDAFVAELSEPIGDALKAKDYEVAYESTVAALESFGELFENNK